MKSYPYIPLIMFLGLAVLFTGCEEQAPFEDDGPDQHYVLKDYPPVQNLDFEVVDDLEGDPGGGVYLFWDTPLGDSAVEYVVSVDGVNQTPVEVTEDYVYTPGITVAVYAVYPDGMSEPGELDFGAVETPSLDVWSVADPSPDHPSGLGFTAAGTAVSYAVSYPENWPDIDYYIARGPALSSPNYREPEPLNDEENASCLESGAYENLAIVKPCGSGDYITLRDINIDDLYGLWIDPGADNYTPDDHFGKAYVIDIQNLKVTLKLAYQTVPGLRWVDTDEGGVGIVED